MADVNCPMCGKLNPADRNICQFCKARLKPLLASTPGDSQPIQPGEEPFKKSTSEFEKVTPSSSNQEPIHPGDEPTKNNTAELERALPSWLRSLRDGNDQTLSEEPVGPSADESSPAKQAPASKPAGEELPGRLAGLGSKLEEEEVPDWLASIRGEAQKGPDIPATEEPISRPLASTDMLDRIDTCHGETPAQEAKPPGTPPEEGTSDWLKDLQAQAAAPLVQEETPATPQGEEDLSKWLENLPAEPDVTHPASAEEASSADTSDWLASLQEKVAKPGTVAAQPPAASGGNLPDWLAGVVSEKSSVGAFTTQPETASTNTDELPDWLVKLQSEAASVPEEKPVEEPTIVADEPAPEKVVTESVPDWLAGVDQAAALPGGTSALISDKDKATSNGDSEAVFSMETPDWLSNLKPEQSRDTAPDQVGTTTDKEPASLEPAELPSWVRAMRPVEAVVSDVKAPSPDEEQTAEERGPLAGLRGVLPAGTGLGPIRKPPTYSVKLQVTEGQQRYAARLEQLVSMETKARSTSAPRRDTSGHILRWVITAVLFLAVGVLLLTGAQLTPASAPYPPEIVAAYNLIGNLPPNSPVLVAFDYEPALSGEMEAAAAPIIDQLLYTGARLTIISTSPTGPALAERFLQNTQVQHSPQSGQSYVNLGYLAGGPAGMLFFAADPAGAAPYTTNGEEAWQLPPLQDIQSLSNFAAIIIITDNADTGRTWIEQTGPYLSSASMMVAISAQAEPMIRPYYDSGQIKGLVTGLAGGKAYEQVLQLPALGQRYWSAFSVGMLAAEIIITIGAAWSVGTTLRLRRATHEEET